MKKIKGASPDIDSVINIGNLPLNISERQRLALAEARKFIEFYEWVGDIKSEFLGAAFDGILYVFLFEIFPARAEVDSWVWVLVGDIPPAYITCEDAKNPYEAIDAYVGAMEDWIEAARAGASVADLIPVDVPATPANAASLAQRLQFIDEQILPRLDK